MANSLDAVIKNWVKQNNNNLKIAFPAVVVGVESLSDGLIDVQPLVNHINTVNSQTVKYPILHDIPIIFPSTKNSTICFPVSQGDFVELVVQSVDIQRFVNGDGEPHSPSLFSFNNLSNTVAFVGFSPFQHSCFNSNNYKKDFNNQDLNIVHNKNTENEITFKLTVDGDLKVLNAKKVSYECEDFEVNASRRIGLTAPLISENGR